MKWWRDTRGMTLIELMVTLVVLSIVTGAVSAIFLVSLQTYWKGDVRTQVQQGGRIALDRLSGELRQARRLYTGTNGSFTFSLSCSQLSFALPHWGNVTLADSSTIYATDPNASGNIPYDGSYVSYYLASTPGGTPPPTPNTTGPYLVRTAYDAVSTTLSSATVANNITGLAFSSSGSCPTTSSQTVTVTLTASQTAGSQSVSATAGLTQDVVIRNH